MALSMSIAIDPERAESGAVSPTPPPGSTAVESPENRNSVQTAPPAPSTPPARLDPPAPSVAGNLVAPRSRDEPEPEPERRREGLKLPLDYSLAAFVEVAGRFAPATAAGGSLQLRGRHGMFSLSLEGRLHPPFGTTLPGGAKISSGLAALVIAPCAHYGAVFACVLALGGEVWASSSAVQDSRTDLALYSALGVRLGLDWPQRGIWAFSLHADGFRPLTQISISLDNETVWTAPSLALAFGAGGVVRF
jgi:hypothetical protein